MSNIFRKIKRCEMKVLFKEFKEKHNLSNKMFDKILSLHFDKVKYTLNGRFKVLLDIALNGFKNKEYVSGVTKQTNSLSGNNTEDNNTSHLGDV